MATRPGFRFLKLSVLATFISLSFLLALVATFRLHPFRTVVQSSPERRVLAPAPQSSPNILVSYSYFEKDAIQVDNFRFFLEAAVLDATATRPITYVIVVSGSTCTPCQKIHSSLSTKAILLHRENDGMDFGSHNYTLEYLRKKELLWKYSYYFLLNSSVKGPFFPSYMPALWHWTDAFVSRFGGGVHAVGSSLVCLPPIDAAVNAFTAVEASESCCPTTGGPGPRLESWAVALDQVALEITMRRQVFVVRTCKMCVDDTGIIVRGEYGLTAGLLAEGHNVATLMSMYAQGVDWRVRENWNCNDNVHPSRHGTYGGIAFHPFETASPVFVKSSWHVADPYTSRYARWRRKHLNGSSGADGKFDRDMYLYAIG
ncbi:hypothetical protein TSOC_004615 [Tetrabaena socialis]|uniref:Uncharacterized protein n=1 Tax=Tetrabaena socialis TaxID=47790 RepID=A0A2J8A8F6_9CHLO|nr:hypothetical protein TSOC_004615 [Tetrabaena socialis]|eukprot:PNH08807.1 hypothetical protein TSOC_004615 [Tetrabaena socialis]